jgi:glycine/D-amino acid oxidase-like deaminating enzyme
MDPMDALQDLIAASRRSGVAIRFRTQVTSIERRGHEIAGVTLNGDESIATRVVVNAAGPWCSSIFQLADVSCPWPLVPTRIQIAQVARPDTVVGDLPVCVDPPSGLYFRTQNRGQQIIVGSVLPDDEREGVEDPNALNRLADDDFVATKLHSLQHLLPGLKELRHVRGYSGLYTMNRADVHPVVGMTPLKGFYAANGCSGHGFKLAPAIGALIARSIVGPASDFDTDVDPSFLAFDRAPIALSSLSVLA